MTKSETPDSPISITLAPGERPTLKTIARLSGLAVPTVSRALSDAPDIGKETKAKVQEIARQIGYRRDRAAVRLRTGKTNVIALVIGADRDSMNHTSHLISSIALQLRETAYHLIVMPYFQDESPMKPVRYLVETGAADGIIINRILPNDPRVAYLSKFGFPFVMHGRTTDCHKHPYFDFDNVTYGRLAVESLHDRGRTNILMVAPPRDQNYAKNMILGAEQEAKARGVTFEVLADADSDADGARVRAAVQRKLTANPDIDAIIGASPSSTMAATLGAEDLGRRLRDNFDIVGKEATMMLRAFRQDMVVVHEDFFEAGRFMARALVHAIDKPHEPPMQHIDKPTKAVRATDFPDWMPVADPTSTSS